MYMKVFYIKVYLINKAHFYIKSYSNNIILIIMEQNICSEKYNPTPIIKLHNIISNNTFDIYVFIGIVEETIQLILDKITQKNKLSKDEINVLKRFRNYGKNINSILGLDSNYRKIYFITEFINIDDTIDIIKKNTNTFKYFGYISTFMV